MNSEQATAINMALLAIEGGFQVIRDSSFFEQHPAGGELEEQIKLLRGEIETLVDQRDLTDSEEDG